MPTIIEEQTISFSKIVTKKMEESGNMTDAELARKINWAYPEIAIAVTTIGKIKNYEYNLSHGKPNLANYSPNLAHVAAICKVLGIDKVTGLDANASIGMEQPETRKAIGPEQMKNAPALIEDPADLAFRGYVGNSFDFFFLGTVPGRQELVCGTMKLSADEKDKICGIEINIKKSEHNEAEFDKTYVGKMVISKIQQACYCTLVSKDRDRDKPLAEICSIVFHHQDYNSGALEARLGLAATVSAGGKHRPTCHRALICREGLAGKGEEERRFIESLLRMDEQEVIISEENFNEIAGKEDFADIMGIIKTRAMSVKPYYVIPDSDVLNAEKYGAISHLKCMETLFLLKEKSIARRNDKISETDDDIAREYLLCAKGKK